MTWAAASSTAPISLPISSRLNPSNTYWTKLYNLYAKVDTEGPRFLDFERWWGGHFLMNKEEIEWIVQNLFVGNKLTSGEVRTADGGLSIDLRNIRSPIVVFASWGDNITPPQQALNWIPDLYETDAELLAHEKVIVYCLHEKIGHLGIFVSTKVAGRETAELVGAIDLIDTLPPGLYEAIIEDTRPDMSHLDLIEGRYLIKFEPRKIADILALDDGREDEQAFEVVKRVAEINQSLYDMFVSPWVKAMSNEATAKWLRLSNPDRMRRYLLSDLNPAMWTVKSLAEMVRAQRMPVAPDNPLAQLERKVSERIEQALDAYRDRRDAMQERLFKLIYESPWVAAAVGLAGRADSRHSPRAAAALREEFARLKIDEISSHIDEGTPFDGWVRMLIWQGMEGRGYRRATVQPRAAELGKERRPVRDDPRRTEGGDQAADVRPADRRRARDRRAAHADARREACVSGRLRSRAGWPPPRGRSREPGGTLRSTWSRSSVWTRRKRKAAND